MAYTIGSIATDVLARVDAVPAGISGNQLLGLIDEARLYVQEYTGLSVGSPSFDDKFRPALVSLATANLLDYMRLVGGDAAELRLGDFTVKKGKDSNVAGSAEAWREDGINKLAVLGRKITYRKVV